MLRLHRRFDVDHGGDAAEIPATLARAAKALKDMCAASLGVSIAEDQSTIVASDKRLLDNLAAALGNDTGNK